MKIMVFRFVIGGSNREFGLLSRIGNSRRKENQKLEEIQDVPFLASSGKNAY